MSHIVEVKVLGSWEVSVEQRTVMVPPGHQRALLVSLLLSVGKPVRSETLARQLWGDQPPANVRRTLSTYVTRLRGVLGKQVIAAYPGGGYLLPVNEVGVDLHRFRELLRRAWDAGRTDSQLALLREALGLWRGRPFTGVESGWLEKEIEPSLTEEWFVASERRIDLELAQNGARDVIAELSQLTTTYPFRESLWLRLIGALHQAGRRADALAAYHRVRTVLRDNLGIDPGEGLQVLHQDVLREVPAGELVRRSEQIMNAPHQLPPDNVKFVGRHDDLAALERLVSNVDSSGAGAVGQSTIIVAIDGAPGTGKTTLAIHWAHRMVHRYPDVQLYLNLRGHSADDPVRSSAAIEAVLRSLGVPMDRIPADLDERSALLRSTLAGRRSLILLDNVRDAAQVRALLPGTDSLVIVTSRSQLRTLSIRDGAQRLILSRLSQDDAVELLGVAVGPERIAAEPQAAKRLAELCDGLPLVLVIVAERAQRAGTLSRVAQTLADEMGGPDTFGAGTDNELYAALSWSYRTLEPSAAAMFRKLGLHPAGDISTDAAGAIADLTAAQAKQVLDQLVDAHMAEQRQPHRYELHDLIRLYAAEEARRNECAEARQAALRRVLDWYLHAAVSADSILQPTRFRDFVAPFEPGVPPPRFADQGLAIAWFEREFDCLQSVVRWAAANGWGGHAWRIVIAMTTFLDRRIAWHEGMEILDTALQAARSAGERVGEGYALNSLSCLQMDKGELAMARDNLRQAVDCFTDEAHRPGVMMVLANLGLVLAKMGEPEQGLRVCADARDLAEELGYQRGVANTLNNMGVAHVAMGDYERAIDCFMQADLLFEEIGDVEPSLLNLHDLGCAYAATRRYAKSIRSMSKAAAGYQRLGSRRWWAVVLIDLGKAISSAGHPRWACAPWKAALDVMQELADPRAQELENLIESAQQ
jgi:DNA-binding SARP family transcriptional activator/tetratricopeptide (TPR) repeat protein